MMKLTSIACREFDWQVAREQRKLQELLVNGAMWKEGRLEDILHEPFQTLAHSNPANTKKMDRMALQNLIFQNGSAS